MIIIGYKYRDNIEQDGAYYLRDAIYHSTGQYHLAINGYWSPMLSWLMAPLLSLFGHPLFAARAVWGFAALLFTAGCLSVFIRLQLPPTGLVIGSWLVALHGACWSLINTSDLLMGGLMCFAIGLLISPRWMTTPAIQVVTGMVFGGTYLAKAVVMPIVFLLILSIFMLNLLMKLADRKVLLRASACTLFGLALVALPWSALLTSKYGKPTFSTTAQIALAIVGPDDVDRGWQPILMRFQKPEPGRISIGEDPSYLPFKYWSPFTNLKYFIHQIRLIKNNQPRPEAVVLGRPPRGGRLREVAPVGGVELERSKLSPRHRQRLLR